MGIKLVVGNYTVIRVHNVETVNVNVDVNTGTVELELDWCQPQQVLDVELTNDVGDVELIYDAAPCREFDIEDEA
jgi:hypothetical protein